MKGKEGKGRGNAQIVSSRTAAVREDVERRTRRAHTNRLMSTAAELVKVPSITEHFLWKTLCASPYYILR